MTRIASRLRAVLVGSLLGVGCKAPPPSTAPQAADAAPVTASVTGASSTSEASGSPGASATSPEATPLPRALPGYASLIANPYGRSAKLLNGKWRTIIDPYDHGYYDYRYEPRGDHWGLDEKPKHKSDRIEYDFDQSPTLQVPGD